MPPKRKLTGAQARLFAQICLHYISAAEEGCNDDPDHVPLFSRLSPQQRLNLVKQVMIGVLCEKEPLPPNTIQHTATYRALIEVLFSQLDVESDMQYEMDDVGQDFLNFDEERPIQRFSEKERKENEFNQKLFEYQAEKNLHKMKSKRTEIAEFDVKEEVPGIGDRYTSEMREETMKGVLGLFEGGPFQERAVRDLNNDEKYAFRWRRLCDAAFQEDTLDGDCHIPLCMVNFDWRCQKIDKWQHAINLLFDTYMLDYGNAKNRALINGAISCRSYADPDQLPRIQAIEKHVEILRNIYEASYDPMKMGLDQRCIFALCSTECFYGYGHQDWAKAFISKCNERGIDFTKDGNYQVRFEIYRDMIDEYAEGAQYPYGAYHESHAKNSHKHWRPSNFKSYDLLTQQCHGPGNNGTYCKGVYHEGICFETENLKACSRCKVVLYCSVECQRKDWPKHKEQCAKLAAIRKNKQEIAAMT
eukprot:CAMPEP_0178927822 /NCGR_PEP_ID=MMETSP0786-20121207/19461_1 /TAXON_ID=186022 /ORGANISM="Thalassionema frauenfeldii, Strain CCMP 1798" /LENGTH=473 /DNA_ID=CAMNT_0020603417 /DNA_START=8 /DNA_END=1425 /DNA_ORIENTATION=+